MKRILRNYYACLSSGNPLYSRARVDFGEHEYSCKVAETVEDAKLLVEAGFEFVVGFEGRKLFRKRK